MIQINSRKKQLTLIPDLLLRSSISRKNCHVTSSCPLRAFFRFSGWLYGAKLWLLRISYDCAAVGRFQKIYQPNRERIGPIPS